MTDYQIQIIEETNIFRATPLYSVYPPYHEGMYLEDLFFKYFLDSKTDTKKIYLPISWTTVYNDGIQGVQTYLNTLKTDEEYFTIAQHDDAVKESLPKNTSVFAAGGNLGGIPIPLVCSEIPSRHLVNTPQKEYLASFVGSLTHPIRNMLYNHFHRNEGFKFDIKAWSPQISHSEIEKFFDITKKSKFTLCPRGYGKSSFRLYETFQLDSVPVYISDQFWLPFTYEFDWADICILLRPDEIGDLNIILENITDSQYNKMLSLGKKIWKEYFELNALCKKIIQII